MERDGLVVIALGSASAESGPAYLTLDEAVSAKAVDIHEMGGGTVPTVAVGIKDSPSSSSAGTPSWVASRTASST